MSVVDHHQQKYLHSIKVKEAACAANVKGGGQRRRRLLLTREASNLSNASIEAEYHAQEPAAVPFVWESSPGTPKRHVITRSSCHNEIDHDEILLPPLTPPPSYHQCRNQASPSRPSFSCSKKKKQIQSMFPRLSFKKDQTNNTPALSSSASTKSSSPTSTSTSTSSSTSSSSSPSSQARSVMSTPSPIHKHRLSFQYSSTDVEEEEQEVGSPVSTLCFRRLSCCNRRFRSLYSRWL